MNFWPFALLLVLPLAGRGESRPADRPIFGSLQCDPARSAENRKAGLPAAVLELAWDRFEPAAGEIDAEYVATMQQQLAAFRAAGQIVILEPGWHYVPAWALAGENTRYVNQYGDAFTGDSPGVNPLNAVFSAANRTKMERYLQRVFEQFGMDFAAVRLGGGTYNELQFPLHQHRGKVNCYWAFDALAQGRATGLPRGISPCPAPGWLPGVASMANREASLFLEWYLECLRNYQDWQIDTARRWYQGTLAIMYPSWGIRPGEAAEAVAGALGGKTSPEINGEVQRGLDFARLIAALDDPKVTLYCTWLDCPHGNDEQPDARSWTPVHYLASLGNTHRLRLRTWGENTGGDDLEALRRCFERVPRLDLLGFLWAFEADLYKHDRRLLKEFTRRLESQPSASHRD